MVLVSIDFASLHTILESLYNEMMPLCEDMLGVAKGVAGLGALFYVALRVWQSMARAEPVDVYPLLRPFALGICMEVGMYNLEKSIRDAFRSLLELLFAAASLLIDTVRTFFLVVLSVLGPIAFSISVWDGLQSTLGQWFTRYISVYLWLPVSDLFSCMLAKIQVLMLQNDIAELQGNPDYSLDNSNCVYIIFMLIGIVGYFTVPTVSGWIVQAGGGGNYSRNLNRTATKAGGFTAGAGGAALGNIGGRIRGK